MIFDADFGTENTFVTGGGLPGRGRRDGDYSDGDDNAHMYLTEEERLLAKVEGYERDMQEMLKFLDGARETSQGGDDLKAIRRMLDATSQSVDNHMAAYTNIGAQVVEMNKDAATALKKIGKHNDDVTRMLMQSE